MPLDSTLIVRAPFDQEGGQQALRQLLALSQPPTAVLAANDILAIGALQAAHETKLSVPDQLSIMGIDDIFQSVAYIIKGLIP